MGVCVCVCECVFVIVVVHACSFVYVKGTQIVTYNLDYILDIFLCVRVCVCVRRESLCM